MLNSEKLYHINKSNEELIQLLSPEISPSNQELFNNKSGKQDAFNKELKTRGVGLSNEEIYPELDDALLKIQDELRLLLKNNSDLKRTRLDLDIAKIFHKNLVLQRKAIVDYDFWRGITLFYFMSIVKWRWENDPSDPSKWYSNAKAICSRSLGLTLNKAKYDETKTILYTVRNQRIDAFRYWWIADKLFDHGKGYYLLDKISEKFKTKDASIQQFLLELEGSRLTSYENRIAKILADAILLSSKKFTEQELEDCFRRFNAFSNRLFMEAEEKIIKREICLLQI